MLERIVFAYWRACMVFRSRSSTISTEIGRPRGRVIERLEPHVELGVLAQVLAVHPDEDPHHHGDEHHHRPRAVRELRDRDHDRDHRGGDRAETVDRETVAPAGFAQAEVAPGHAGLRQGERGEHADRVQRDQLVDVGPEHDHERGRGDRETDDAVGEHQPLPALGERPRHEVIPRVEVRQSREVGERGVRGQDQDQRRRHLEHQEHRGPDRSAAEDRPPDLAR